MKKLWKCVPSDVEDPKDVHVLWADDKKEVLDKLADIYKDDESLRKFVCNFSVNMSFSERFYKDDKGYLFNDYGLIREDIQEKFNYDYEEAWNYVYECFDKNVKEFFKREPELGDIYLCKRKGEDIDFSERFYWYCCRYNRDWIDWIIEKVEDKRFVKS